MYQTYKLLQHIRGNIQSQQTTEETSKFNQQKKTTPKDNNTFEASYKVLDKK